MDDRREVPDVGPVPVTGYDPGTLIARVTCDAGPRGNMWTWRSSRSGPGRGMVKVYDAWQVSKTAKSLTPSAEFQREGWQG